MFIQWILLNMVHYLQNTVMIESNIVLWILLQSFLHDIFCSS